MMHIFDKITKRFTKTASEEVRKEVKATAIDLLPKVIGIGAAVIGALVFKDAALVEKPVMSTTRMVTNNYFLGTVGEEVIKKIIEKEGL